MAANNEIIDSFRTVQVLSQQTVVDIQYITARTLPTGMTFSYAMARSTWLAGPPYVIIDEMAALLESLVTSSHVVAGQAVQDQDASGLLTDFVDLVVRYIQPNPTPPPLQGTVSYPIGQLALWAGDPNIAEAAGGPTPAQVMLVEYNRLKGLAGS